MRSLQSWHENDIEDIVQDAYVGYLEARRDRGAGIENDTGYFFGVLRFIAFAYMRRLPRREAEQSLTDAAEQIDPNTPESLLATGENSWWFEEARKALHVAIREFLDGPDWKRGMQNIGIAALTAREKEVLMLFLAGRRFQEIAHDLGISTKTTSSHYVNLCRKISASNPVEVVKTAIREQLITV